MSGSSLLPSNYRPISMLSFFNKIFEKIMYNKIYAYITKYNILYEYQFGFRRDSTHHALINLVDSLTKALDSGKLVIGVILDSKKAVNNSKLFGLVQNVSR